MELNGAGTPVGAVACPVCTLYLREGISLQKHLDTHSKEQVIEALIKANASLLHTKQQQQQARSTSAATSLPLSLHPRAALHTSTPIQAPQTSTHVSHQKHISTHSPYPVGPICSECPPISTMVPPQFTSFSYQQFENNGTMMIPQYAIARRSSNIEEKVVPRPPASCDQGNKGTLSEALVALVSGISVTTRRRKVYCPVKKN